MHLLVGESKPFQLIFSTRLLHCWSPADSIPCLPVCLSFLWTTAHLPSPFFFRDSTHPVAGLDPRLRWFISLMSGLDCWFYFRGFDLFATEYGETRGLDMSWWFIYGVRGYWKLFRWVENSLPLRYVAGDDASASYAGSSLVLLTMCCMYIPCTPLNECAFLGERGSFLTLSFPRANRPQLCMY